MIVKNSNFLSLKQVCEEFCLVAVFPGDVIVGDGEGVVVIPAHLAAEIAAEAVEMTAFEDFVTAEVLKGRSILGLYPPTEEKSRSDFEAWRRAQGR